jgi:hypothetical protein
MSEVTQKNFGLLIAYLLPGFVALWGVSFFSSTVKSWLSGTSPNSPTVGGFLYVTLASIGAGLTVSVVRWAVIDTIHHWTGIPDPKWDFSKLQENIAAFDTLVEIHYRYFQFYSNSLVSLLFLYVARRIAAGSSIPAVGLADLDFLLLACIFFAGSRDTLNKYYTRVGKLLGTERTDLAEHRSV